MAPAALAKPVNGERGKRIPADGNNAGSIQDLGKYLGDGGRINC